MRRRLLCVALLAAMVVMCPGCDNDQSGAPAGGSGIPSEADHPKDAFQDATNLAGGPDGEPVPLFPDQDIYLWARPCEQGIEYDVRLLDALDQSGFIGPGESATLALGGLISLTVEVLQVWPDEHVVRASFTTSGIYEEEWTAHLPFGEYSLYWGQDRAFIPPSGEDDSQAWIDMRLDSVEYFGECVYPARNAFHVEGLLTEDGQTAAAVVPYMFKIEMQFSGMGQPDKLVNVKVSDDFYPYLYWDETYELENSLIALRLDMADEP